jgi:hypothetical protein
VKSYTWGIILYGAETWRLRKVDHKYLGSFETWCWRRMEKISWTDRVKNEEVLQESRMKGTFYNNERRKVNWIGY